jgi:hypothetical protein
MAGDAASEPPSPAKPHAGSADEQRCEGRGLPPGLPARASVDAGINMLLARAAFDLYRSPDFEVSPP